MKIREPYHEGEVRVQELAGERDVALLNAGTIGDRVIAPAFRFLAMQRYLVLGRADGEHDCAATVLFGAPGFLRIEEDGKALSIALEPERARHVDPVLAALAAGDRMSGLAIELATRRRLRLNGRVRALDPARLVLEVDESYQSCPKYIQKRVVEVDADFDSSIARSEAAVSSGAALLEAQRAVVRAADTLFVVTVHPEGHADASHRGGEPGFVRIDDDGTLSIPDYVGNSMFNTLGNITTNPRAALLFWDFDQKRLLHLAGRAELRFRVGDHELATGATGRSWTFRTERWIEQRLSLPFRMRLVERSPFNPTPTTRT